MPLSWNEIKNNAIQFSREWAEAKRERADAKTFWDEFFGIFGIRRRVYASFEEPVKTIRGTYGLIDLFWKGTLIAEHKSAGADLDKAHSQAMAYIQELKNDGREIEVPRYVAVCDFQRFVLHDLDENRSIRFNLSDLHRHIHDFAFIPGYRQQVIEDQDPINIKAVELMGNLHDALEDSGYKGHNLERCLVRVLFCLFADDTGIFDRNVFATLVEQTRENGADVGRLIEHIFQVLNTPEDERLHGLDETIASLPFVNGGLFEERLPIAAFDARMRQALLTCCRFDWSRISPAVFGSLFQSVMEPRERRRIGGHYTSERDILKVVQALFLDELRTEFDRIKNNINKLHGFHEKLATMRCFDPACGCGNFLVVAYRELRLLELEVISLLAPQGLQITGVEKLSRIDVDAMYGIECSEFPARIAEVALWLTDHQMNLLLSERFGRYLVRLPLRKSPTIVIDNALRIDWKKVLPPSNCSYILGNPPFVGKQYMTDSQNEDMRLVCGNYRGHGILDYVTAWYFRAAEYIRGAKIVVGFVSTNSITQGEQVAALWGPLFGERGIKIHFAYRTFAWDSEARGKAHVHVVIVGFAAFDKPVKLLYEAQGRLKEGTTIVEAKNIGPYLVEGNDLVIESRTKPICDVPEIVFGNMPNDGGHLLLSEEERKDFVKVEPGAKKFIRPYVGSHEFIHNVKRWCLWLADASSAELRALPHVMKRVSAVKRHRLESKRATTRKLAENPTLFGEVRQPRGKYLLVPSVSSEHRIYIPMGFVSGKVICSNLVLFVPDATLFHFGVLMSSMHMAWVRQVCGRLESRYRYSGKLVYNNYPWPEMPESLQRTRVERAAQSVLDARAQFFDSSLDSLYHPLMMPKALNAAHRALDRAVDRCYRRQPFRSDRERVEFLFALYEKLTSPLAPSAPSGARRTRRPKKKTSDPLAEDLQLHLFTD
jgi:hypothetical protein